MKNTVIGLIEKSAEEFGRINLSSGNCGQFSIALAKKLIDIGYDASIGILHKYDEDVSNLDELAAEELPIYHVVVLVEDSIFDGTGEITVDDLIKLSTLEYRDNEPSYIKDIDINDMALDTIINFVTDWSIPKEKFYKFLSQPIDIKNRKKSKLNL